MRILKLSIIIAITFVFTVSATAQVTYSFKKIGSNITNSAIGKSQLFTDVSYGGLALPAFRNAEPQIGSITDIYLDDNHLPEISAPTNNTSDAQFLQLTASQNPSSVTIAKKLDTAINDLANHGVQYGIHVPSFDDGGSKSFVNNGVLPAPGAVLLASVGMACVGWFRKRGYF